MKKWYGLFLCAIGICLSTYFALHTDYYIYNYGNKDAIINRFKLSEKQHTVFSGEQINEIAISMQKNSYLSAFDKLELARELIYQQTLVNHESMDVLDTNKILFSTTQQQDAFTNIINAMNQSKKGIKCAGTATILALLYRNMGYHAWLYAYGSLDSNSRLTHTLTLVELNNKIYLQDAYFNYAYTDKNHHLIPFEEVLNSNKKQEKVYISEGQLNYRRRTVPTSITQPINVCKAALRDPTSPANDKKVYWSTYHIDVMGCMMEEPVKHAEAREIVLKDYQKFAAVYLVNYPIWLTDMDTLIYYPLANYKNNKLFASLTEKSNRSHFIG